MYQQPKCKSENHKPLRRKRRSKSLWFWIWQWILNVYEIIQHGFFVSILFPSPYCFIHVVHLVFLSCSVPLYENSKNSSIDIPVDGHMCHLQFLGHMNKSTTNIVVQVFWWTHALVYTLGIHMEVEYVGYRVRVNLTLWETVQQLFNLAIYLISPLATYETTSCSTSQPAFDSVSLFHFSSTNDCVVIASWWFMICKISLYILDTYILIAMQIFSARLWLISKFLNIPFNWIKFLILPKSKLSCFSFYT